MWGLALIGMGTLFFLDRINMVDIEDLWHYWPLLLIVVGLNKMIGYPTAKHFVSGLWTVFMGCWLFAVFEGLYGLTFGNSWPIVIIAWGVQMILEPIVRERFAANKE